MKHTPLVLYLKSLNMMHLSFKTKLKAHSMKSPYLKIWPVGFSRGPSYTSHNKVVASKHHSLTKPLFSHFFQRLNFYSYSIIIKCPF